MLQFEKLLLSLEGQLLEGQIFRNCVEQEFDFPGVWEVKTNPVFQKEFDYNVRAMYARMTSKSGDLTEIYQRRRFIGLCALYTFCFKLFPQIDKAFFRDLWEMRRVIPIVHLIGNIVWFPTEFLSRQVPYMVDQAIGQVDVKKYIQQYTTDLDRAFNGTVAKQYVEVSKWSVRMEVDMTNRANTRQILKYRIGLVLSGLRMAYELGDMFKQYIYLFSYLRKPLPPSKIRTLCQCLEMIKAIQYTFHRQSATLGESIAFMTQQMQFTLQRQFLPIKQHLASAKKFNAQSLDNLSAANLALNMLNGCATDDRRLLLRLAMHVLFQLPSIDDEKIEQIKDQARRLDLICNLQQSIDDACDCSFFYWSRVMVPPYFKDIFEHPQQASKLHYMFAVFRDVVPLFKQVVHVEPQVFMEKYNSEVDGALEDHILSPLCTAIEVDLRYHIHTHLDVHNQQPFKEGVKDLANLVKVRPLRFFDRLIDFKAYVTQYLDRTFYNLTTVALYDWKTYAEMRNLAREKYGVNLMEVFLPGQTLEQGVDVLEIMRNIHIFVASYDYNQNNQIFVEKKTSGKYLNTVNIGHVANSLRTHGIGIMNTTVNFTFQFLRQKFMIFSQFLYDEHIKARLFKDVRFFRDHKDELNARYPYDRANKFNSDIRKLGLTDNLTYLDQFRKLVTEIGNAMGYIRLVRSGGLQYISNAIKFLPDLQNITKFEELVKHEGLAPSTTTAARNLDGTVENLVKNFSEGTDYFKVLVNAFAGEFRNEENVHLKNFYIIIPPLTLNYITHMQIAKDKKQFKGKRNKEAVTFFTDDGFAIGIAYILKLLDQNMDFDSLHWFDSVTTQFRASDRQLKQKVKASKGGKKQADDQQTALLTLKKNQAFMKEFQLLRYSFQSARIFFRD